MKTITRAQLIDLLASQRTSTFFSFTSLTKVKVPKEAPAIYKLSRVNGCCGSYANAVAWRRAKCGNEEPFIPKPRKWGESVSWSLVRHHSKDAGLKHYLSLQVLKARPAIYLVQQPPLKPGRRPRLIGVDKAEIARWLPPDNTKEVAAAQGVEQAVIHRDYDLANISSISIGGEVYHLTGD